ncbi:hypothetical protein I3J27_31640 [Bradyrhizobium xenonodulans]|uniref:Uncharacterized protein n=1 Tax=Bradyrhizobium xenonodulans TaxID=2736875 RepID=A0ABY7MIW8_9BRAD|nr:hypothetical protein [Bradyrhizobium xenonodulans]WBL77531.1 hypothetical protein I3J27_31640 [Bradyrhizobium xenonodulans]
MSSRLKPWLLGLASVFVVATLVLHQWDRPRFSLNPFCSVRFAYRVDATIEVDGRQYASKAFGELQHNRINTGGGCLQPVGSIIAFRLADSRLVLLYATLCRDAVAIFSGGRNASPTDQGEEETFADDSFVVAMKEHKKVDLIANCNGKFHDRYDGYIVDNADTPTKWRGFTFNGTSPRDPRLLSAIAEGANLPPDDSIEIIAPATLETDFKYNRWEYSPSGMLYSRRRVNQKNSYTATEERT